MNVYRFRSMEYLLGGEYQELEKQAIYFASPDELNDPMEGFRDIVWRGDKIVWTNFFKNYIYYLYASYLLLSITSGSAELDSDIVPIPGQWDEPPTPLIRTLFDDHWHRFLNLPNIQEVIEALANTNRQIRYRELEYYLRLIQGVFSTHIIELEIEQLASKIERLEQESEQVLISESERRESTEGDSQEALEDILTMLTAFEKTLTEEQVNTMFQNVEALINRDRIIHQLNSPISTGKLETHDKLFYDSPKQYLQEIEKLLWPNWYTACFMKDYHNSSVWAHYGDRHRGVCLIFESEETRNSNNLDLHQVAGQGVKTVRFYEINYVDKPSEIDFFRSIGGVPLEELIRRWYADEEGNISECAAHIRPGDDTVSIVTWAINYGNNFRRVITTKTKDWEYEQECRLILEDGSDEFDEENNRALTYNFNSLKGIIFGINTSDEDKLKIIEILQRKCKENSRTDFKFFQAYYSPEDGNIHKAEIQLTSPIGAVGSNRQTN